MNVSQTIRVHVVEDVPALADAVGAFVAAVGGADVDVSVTTAADIIGRIPADVIVADDKINGLEGAGSSEAKRACISSGGVARAIIFTKESTSWGQSSSFASAFVSKAGDDDDALADIFRRVNDSTELIAFLRDGTNGSASNDAWKAEFSVAFDLAFAVRTAIREARVLKATVPFTVPMPLRLELARLQPTDRSLAAVARSIQALTASLDPAQRNHGSALLAAAAEWLEPLQAPHAKNLLELLREFASTEPFLYADPRDEASGRYREHFFHATQVMLLGIWILGRLEGAALSPPELEKLTRSWILTSLFHDVGYVLSAGGRTLSRFATSLVGAADRDESWLSSILGAPEFRADLSYLSALACDSGKRICCSHVDSGFHCARTHLENQMSSAARSRLDHGVISALVLLRNYYPNPNDIEDKVDKEKLRDRVALVKRASVEESLKTLLDDDGIVDLNFHRDILAKAAVAIAAHDQVFPHFAPITFENEPLTFMLKFCDVCQQYGRVPALFGDFSRSDDTAELLGVRWMLEDRVLEVTLGCQSTKRWNAVRGEAALLLGRFLASDQVDFRLVALNLENEECGRQLAKSIQVAAAGRPVGERDVLLLRDGSLCLKSDCGNTDWIDSFSTRKP